MRPELFKSSMGESPRENQDDLKTEPICAQDETIVALRAAAGRAQDHTKMNSKIEPRGMQDDTRVVQEQHEGKSETRPQ